MMTNGEKIKEIFPYLESDKRDLVKVLNIDNLKNWWNSEYQEPTTKNNLGVEKIIDELEKEFEKVDIPIMEKLTLFAKVQNALYKCAESNSEIPTGSTTKNYLGVDLIDREKAIEGVWEIELAGLDNKKVVDMLKDLPSVTPQLSSGLEKNSKKLEKNFGELDCISRKAILDELEKWDWQELYLPIHFKQMLDELPTVTPQEPQLFEWCETCKEYDQEKHCCHRWSKVIRNTVEELKQEYIERDILDKIRVELHATAEMHDDGDYYLREEWIDEILDNYKTETEET